MNKSLLASLSGMSSSMVMALIGTVLVSGFVTTKIQSSLKLPHDFDQLDHEIRFSQDQIAIYTAAPVVPPLESSWRQMNAVIDVHGLELIALDDGTETGGTTYDGPLRSWTARINGDAQAVLAAVREAQQESPIELLDYEANDGTFSIFIAVLGI